MDGLAIFLIIVTAICAIIGILLLLKPPKWGEGTGDAPREEQEYVFIFPRKEEHKAALG